VAGVAGYVAGREAPPPRQPAEVQRLGPEPGEPVTEYLARARTSVPARDAGQVWALVQLAAPLDTEAAARLVSSPLVSSPSVSGSVRLSRVVFRVPLPRVQTALVTRELSGQRPAEELAGAQLWAADERAAAGQRAAADGAARAAAVAAAEADALRAAGCACVLAMLVRADRAGLDALAAQPAVRAVHAATPDTPLPSIATSPLLPEQTVVAGQVPDDGPLPTPEPSR